MKTFKQLLKEHRFKKSSRRLYYNIINLLRRFIYNIFYWLRCHTYNKYHLIDISNQDGYKWGWIDRDHAMFLACFKLFIDYFEQESQTIDWDCNEELKQVHIEMCHLYKWYKRELPKLKKTNEDLEQEMLLRLIKIRPYLWS